MGFKAKLAGKWRVRNPEVVGESANEYFWLCCEREVERQMSELY